jgi:CRP/FNR family transcriptional regulator, cyclic AMP receptor protein
MSKTDDVQDAFQADRLVQPDRPLSRDVTAAAKRSDRREEGRLMEDVRRDLRETCWFFQGLSLELVDRMIAQVVVQRHEANQVILLENDWGSSIYFILDGWVKVRTHNLDGKEITLNVLGRGEMFGEMAALDEVPRSTDVMTLVATQIGNIPAQDFIDVTQSEPKAGVRLAQMMARRLRQVNRRLRMREADSMARVADVLLFLVDGQTNLTPNRATIPNLPHREISSLSGLARETVTRSLIKLEKQGHIQRQRDVLEIPDLGSLEKLLV